jgi:predicted metalloendopeptidase
VYARDVIQMLGATNQDANYHANLIFNYEARIASVMPDTINSSMRENFTKVRVEALKSMSNTIFWDDFLKGVFPQGHISDDTEVLVTSLEYLKDISMIISTSESIVLNDYLIWHLTHKYLPYLSMPFLEAQETLRMDLTGSKKRKPRWEFCTDETLKVFSPVINALLARNCEKRGAKLAKVDSMFDDIKKSLTDRIQESTRFDEKLRAWAVDKLRLMTIKIGAIVENRKTLIDFYHSLMVQNNELFLNVVAANNFLLKIEQRDLTMSDKKAFMFKNLYEIQFDPTSNQVVFPESRLQNDDLLVTEDQKATLYGSLGVELAEVVARAFGPKDGLYLADGTFMSERDSKYQETLTLIEQKRSCLASFFTKIHLDDEAYIQRTSLDTTLHLAGIEIALGAMGNSISTELPSLPYGRNEIFFLAYGQSQCSSNTLAFHDMEHASFTTLVHEHRVRGVLRQLGAFTDSYKCAKTTEMYADFRCGFVL